MASLSRAGLPARLLAAILAFATLFKPTASFLSGIPVACDVEGEPVHVSFIASDPCIKCSCLGGEVVCEKNTCEATLGCHMLLYSGASKQAQQSVCCDVCKGCRAAGQTFVSGQTALSRHDVCERSHCLAGVLTISRASCHAPCKSATFMPGLCCPTCPGCEHDGVQHADGETFSLRADPCVACTCQAGRTSCERMTCPVLNCPQSAIVQPPGQCCPVCQGKRKVFDLAQACLFRSKTYRHGQEADGDDECTSCSCQNGTMVCRRQAACDREPCSAADDAPESSVATRGSKCGQRVPPPPPPQPCTFDGVTREHGATWESRCASCKCDNGTTECTRRPCPGIAPAVAGVERCDPATHEWKYLHDECCPICVERSGVCSVFGDAHFKALDGDVRSFVGTCKYALAKECGGGSSGFSVVVSTQSHYGSSSRWIKSVLLSTRNGSRVRLLRSGEVRVDRRSVRLPYERAASKVSAESLTIWRDEDDNVVAEQGGDHGIKVVWDTEGYLEVHTPASYRRRTCGLCGSGGGNGADAVAEAAVNSNAFDERAQPANAAVAISLPASIKASSFGADGIPRYESDDGCAASDAVVVPATAHVGQLQQCQDSVGRWRRAHQECSFLKSSMFASCGSKVPVAPYYSACVADSCNCPKHRLCACDSLTAYERACERAGYPGRRSVVSECRNRVKKTRLRSRS